MPKFRLTKPHWLKVAGQRVRKEIGDIVEFNEHQARAFRDRIEPVTTAPAKQAAGGEGQEGTPQAVDVTKLSVKAALAAVEDGEISASDALAQEQGNDPAPRKTLVDPLTQMIGDAQG